MTDIKCPKCGTAWDPDCPNATPPSWDPTRGITELDKRGPVRPGSGRRASLNGSRR